MVLSLDFLHVFSHFPFIYVNFALFRAVFLLRKSFNSNFLCLTIIL